MKGKQGMKMLLLGILLFLSVFAAVCRHFYVKSEQQSVKQKKLESEKKAERNELLNLHYIGYENIPFLTEESEFKTVYESYIKDILKLPKVSTTVFFANYEKLSDNIYLLYSQIDDTASTVLQTVCNIKEHTYEITRSKKELADIEALGGVIPSGQESLSEKYHTGQEKNTYAEVIMGEHENNETEKTIQQYAWIKYQKTDIQVEKIQLLGVQQEGEYQVYLFRMEDLVGTEVSVFCEKDGTPLFTMER